MDLRKPLAVGVSVALLGTQLWAILPPGNASWKSYYWPFMDYPMYSEARRPGDLFVQHRLTGTRCGDEAGEPEEIRHRQIRLQRFNFYYAMWRIAAPASADARLAERFPPAETERATRQINRLIESRMPGEFCRAQVWEQAYVLGAPEPDGGEPAWTMLREWEVPAADAAPEARP